MFSKCTSNGNAKAARAPELLPSQEHTKSCEGIANRPLIIFCTQVLGILMCLSTFIGLKNPVLNFLKSCQQLNDIFLQTSFLFKKLAARLESLSSARGRNFSH